VGRGQERGDGVDIAGAGADAAESDGAIEGDGATGERVDAYRRAAGKGEEVAAARQGQEIFFGHRHRLASCNSRHLELWMVDGT
jgi:hypothetical protein